MRLISNETKYYSRIPIKKYIYTPFSYKIIDARVDFVAYIL